VITPYIASQAEAGLTYSILQSRSSCLLKVKEEIDGIVEKENLDSEYQNLCILLII
jgi:hypothetical protein